MLNIVIPTNKEHWLDLRKQVLTSTEVAALFNASPYVTEFELFHNKKNKTSADFEPSERMKWGSRLERSIADGVAEDNGWKIRHMGEFMFDDVARIGASFDYSIEKDEPEILEIKCVDGLRFKESWIVEDDHVEASPVIELQVQTQMLVSGRKKAWIAALVGGNNVVMIEREANTRVHEAILIKAAEFWKRVDENREPEPNLERDAQFIADLHSYAEPGKVVDAAAFPGLDDIMRQYAAFQEQESRAAKQKEACKAQALMLIGDAEKVIAPDWSISAGLIGPKLIESYTRAGYRNFRMNKKKIKEEANAATNIAS